MEISGEMPHRSEDWRGRIVQFNMERKDSQSFARELYRRFPEAFDENCEYHHSLTGMLIGMVRRRKVKGIWRQLQDDRK